MILFYMDKTMMLFGDGKAMMSGLNNAVKRVIDIDDRNGITFNNVAYLARVGAFMKSSFRAIILLSLCIMLLGPAYGYPEVKRPMANNLLG